MSYKLDKVNAKILEICIELSCKCNLFISPYHLYFINHSKKAMDHLYEVESLAIYKYLADRTFSLCFLFLFAKRQYVVFERPCLKSYSQ